MQQIRKLGYLPQESESQPQEQQLARQVREAKANGLLSAFTGELKDMAAKDAEAADTSTDTQHAQYAESLMQRIRKLGHLPQESQSQPQE